MEQDPQNHRLVRPSLARPANGAVSARSWLRRSWRSTAIGLLLLGGVVAGFGWLRGLAQDGGSQDTAESKENRMPMYVGWKTPDLAIVLSGQMLGYTQPCGCSVPQLGGLARRFNFIQSLKNKGWPVTAIDLGELAQAPSPEQRLKYITSMKALKAMGYQAIGLGKNEVLMPLTEALAHYSINDPVPRPVAANLNETSPGQLFHDMNVRPYHTFKAGNVRVAVAGSTGPEVAKEITDKLPATEKEIKFLPGTCQKLLTDLAKESVDLRILLYQAEEKEAEVGAAFMDKEAGKNPGLARINVVVCLTNEEAPPSIPMRSAKYPNTQIITLGHKGRYVGVLGVWKKDTGVELKYQLVAIAPEFNSKPGQEKSNPVHGLLQQLAQEIKAGNYLNRFQRGNHEVQAAVKGARFVGTKICIGCHDDANTVWEKSKHAHAFDALVKAKNPSLRQFDGECIVCHTVGYKYYTGYYDPPQGATPKQVAKHNSILENVGCESCHGPGSAHANNPNNTNLYSLINPRRASEKERNPATPANEKAAMHKIRMSRIDTFCQKCHDTENDVHWNFDNTWKLIAHPTQKNRANGAQANNGAKVIQKK